MGKSLERVVMIDLGKDQITENGNIIYDIGIVIIAGMDCTQQEPKPHIEISYQFEIRDTDETVGDGIAIHEEKAIANILKDLFAYSTISVYAMYDAHILIPFLDEFLSKHGYRNAFKNKNILDIKTISRDRLIPPYTFKKLISTYALDDPFSEDHLAIDRAKLLLQVLFQMQKEKADLGFYINLKGFTAHESHSGFLPCPKVQTLPQKSNGSQKLYEGFIWDGYQFESILDFEKEPIYIIKKDSKFGIGIFVNDPTSLYDILLPCEYDNIFTINLPFQEETNESEYDTFIYSCYFILVKDGKQGLCRVRYNKERPAMRKEFSLHYAGSVEYDHITACGGYGFLLHKGKEKRYYSMNNKRLTDPFSDYKLECNHYLIIWREDGVYVLHIIDDALTKITDAREEHLFYIGSNFFAGCYDTDHVYMLTQDGVKEFKHYKYEFSISVGIDQHMWLTNTYLVVSGPKGLGVLNKDGEFIITPEQDTILPELLFVYLRGENFGEMGIPIKGPWKE